MSDPELDKAWEEWKVEQAMKDTLPIDQDTWVRTDPQIIEKLDEILKLLKETK